jgi:hypothetical protein
LPHQGPQNLSHRKSHLAHHLTLNSLPTLSLSPPLITLPTLSLRLSLSLCRIASLPSPIYSFRLFANFALSAEYSLTLSLSVSNGAEPPFFFSFLRIPLAITPNSNPLLPSHSRKSLFHHSPLRLMPLLVGSHRFQAAFPPPSASRALALASGTLSWPPLTTLIAALSQAGRNPDRPPYFGYLRPDR